MTISSQSEDMLTQANNILADKNNLVIEVEPLTRLTIQAPSQGNIVIKAGEGITAIQSLKFVRHGDKLEIFSEQGHQPLVVIEGYYAQEDPCEIYGIDDKAQLYTWSGADNTSLVSAQSEEESSIGQGAQRSGELAAEPDVMQQQDNDNDKGAAGLFGMSGWTAAAAGLAAAAVAGGAIAAARHNSHSGGDTHHDSSGKGRPDSASDIHLTDKNGHDVAADAITEESHLLISGQATPGCTVVVKNGNIVLGNAPVDKNGHWELPLDLGNGSQQITTEVVDSSNNSSDPTVPIDIQVLPDLTPPDAAYDITITDKDGAVVNGNATNDSTPTIHGKAEPGTTVIIKDGDKVIGSAQVDQNGDWQITPDDALSDGSNNLIVEVIDEAANSTSSDLNVIVDTIPPSGTLTDIQLINDSNPEDLHPVINGITNDNTPVLSGSVEGAETGDRVVIKDGGVVIGQTEIDADGHWSFKPNSPLGEGDHHLSAELQDSVGNAGDSQRVDVIIDTAAPDVVHDIIVSDKDGNELDGIATNDSTPTIHGKAEPGTTVTIKDGEKVIGSAQVDQNGDWQIIPDDALNDGSNNLTVEVTDEAGNSTSSDLTVIVDTMPPLGTTTVELTNDADLPIDAGHPTNDKTPTISGHVEGGEPGDRVVVKDNGAVIGEATIGSDGNWTFTPDTDLTDGAHSITATVTDAAGNVGTPSASVDYTQDTVAPAGSTTVSLTNDAGLPIDAGHPTNDKTPTISGHVEGGEPGDRVVVKDNGAVIGEATIGSDGNWTFTPDTDLTDGAHSITATVTDAAGNVGTPSASVDYTQDTVAPAGSTTVSLTNDAGLPIDAGHPTNDKTPTISGHVEGGEPGDRVVVKDNGAVIGEATIGSDGNWTFTPDTDLTDGAHSITATVTDAAGNVGTPSASVDYTQDTVAPDVATDIHVINDVTDTAVMENGITNDSTPTLSGKAAAGSTINILDKEGHLLSTVQADENGDWKTSVPTLTDGFYEGLQVQVVDEAGNHAETAVPAFTVDTVNDNTTSIVSTSGKIDTTPTFNGQVILADGDTYQTVTVTIKDDNGTVIASGIPVNEDGSWHYTPDAQHPLAVGSHHISAVVIDNAGNESQPGWLNGSSDGSMTIIPSDPVVISSSAPGASADMFGYAIATSDDYIYISAPRAGLSSSNAGSNQGVIYAISKNYAHLITQSCDIETLLKQNPEIGTIIHNNSAVVNPNGDVNDWEGYGLKALDGGWVAIYSHWNDKVFFIKEPLPQDLDLKDISNAPGGHSEYGFMITDDNWGKYFAFNVGSIANKDGTLTFLISDISAPRGEHGAITTITFDPVSGKWGNVTMTADPTNGTEHAGWVPKTDLPEGMTVGHIDHEDSKGAGTTQNNNLGSDIQMLGDIFGDGHQYLAIQDAESSTSGVSGRGTWYLYQVPETGLPANIRFADLDDSQLIRINNIGNGLLNEINLRPNPDGGSFEQIPHTHNIANLGGFSSGTGTDIAIGSSTDNYKGANGKVWILHADKLNGDINIGVNDLSQTFDTKYGYAIISTNHASGQGFGLNVIGGYDFNGDEIQDLVISDPNAKDTHGNVTGAVYIVYGGHEADYQSYLVANNGQIDIQDILDNGWGEVHYGTVNNQMFGWSVDVADINGDGRPDLLVGAPSSMSADVNSDLHNGQVYMIYNTHDEQPASRVMGAFAENNDMGIDAHDDAGVGYLLDGDHQNVDLANLTAALKGHHNVDMSDGNNTLTVGNHTVDGMLGEDDDASSPLIITGENGNVELSGGAENWHSNGTVTVEGTSYQEFQSSGQSDVLIEDRIHVTIL